MPELVLELELQLELGLGLPLSCCSPPKDYDYFGFKTLEKSYLLRVHGKIAERPQHLLMRVACGIHCGDVDAAVETYDLMSRRYFTHASPTMFNAGTPRPQMSSCFLLTMKDDSIEGIFDTLKRCALISKSAGGIGVAVSNVRAKGSYIRGTNGTSNGLLPCLRNFNETARYVDQGGGKRKGSIAIYLEPWHADVFDFLELKKNHGKEEQRARDLFYGLWVPDLFMRRVKENGEWTLFCPNEAFDAETGKGLMDVWGEEFDEMYARFEAQGIGRKTVKAQQLWFRILESQMETGTPYMLYKDQANRKSNQQNLGTIHCSNLCTEIIEYTDADEVAIPNLPSTSHPPTASCPAAPSFPPRLPAPLPPATSRLGNPNLADEVAVCNLASLGLPAFASAEGEAFDFQRPRAGRVRARGTNPVSRVVWVLGADTGGPTPLARPLNSAWGRRRPTLRSLHRRAHGLVWM